MIRAKSSDPVAFRCTLKLANHWDCKQVCQVEIRFCSCQFMYWISYPVTLRLFGVVYWNLRFSIDLKELKMVSPFGKYRGVIFILNSYWKLLRNRQGSICINTSVNHKRFDSTLLNNPCTIIAMGSIQILIKWKSFCQVNRLPSLHSTPCYLILDFLRCITKTHKAIINVFNAFLINQHTLVITLLGP